MEMAEGVLDVLGVLIGFIGVMAILSLVVTGLVQMTQVLLRLRGRNLYRSLVSLMNAAGVEGEHDRSLVPAQGAPDAKSPEAAAGEAADSKSLGLSAETWALSILRSDALVHVGMRGPGVKGVAWLGQPRSWIEKEELIDALRDRIPKEKLERAAQLFARMEKSSTKRFSFLMHANAACWALVVAAAFQVSAFGLLRQLSRDDLYRQRMIEVEKSLLEESGGAAPEAGPGEPSAAALSRLQAEFPGATAALEAAGGRIGGEADVAAALDAALAPDLPERAEILRRCAEIVAELQEERLRAARDAVESSLSKLGRFDIALWAKGARFYWDRGPACANVVGVLVTAVLLTFGAPFWFEQLKRVSNLQDALTAGMEAEKPPGAGGGGGAGGGAKT